MRGHHYDHRAQRLEPASRLQRRCAELRLGAQQVIGETAAQALAGAAATTNESAGDAPVRGRGAPPLEKMSCSAPSSGAGSVSARRAPWKKTAMACMAHCRRLAPCDLVR